jgi:ABC-type phosphate transport system permease subunit
LFTSSLFGDWISGNPGQAMASIPVIIFEYSEAPDPHLNDQAWAAAFVLITFVLVISLLSRFVLARARRRLERG